MEPEVPFYYEQSFGQDKARVAVILRGVRLNRSKQMCLWQTGRQGRSASKLPVTLTFMGIIFRVL